MIFHKAYPVLDNIACDKEASVGDLMHGSSRVKCWDIMFTRPFHDRELETLQSFITLLYSINIGSVAEDRIGWHPAKSNIF